MTVPLTLSCGEYDLTQTLLTGEVVPAGVDLTTVTYRSRVRHGRMLTHLEFDVCELSLGSYLVSRAAADDYPFTAIPVFPHRRFRHAYFFKRTDAGIDGPADLAGQRVGIASWQNTAGIWMRGIAHEHYGLDLRSVEWVAKSGEDVPLEPPAEFDLSRSDLGSYDRMLLEGDVDAGLFPGLPEAVKDPDSPVERVFSDARAEEERYYEASGIFPVMHVVVVRDDLLDANPWVAVSVLDAFREARDVCLEKLEDPRWTALAWARDHLEHQQAVLGYNPWPCGLTDGNRRALDTFQAYALDQGLVPRTYEDDELFVPSTLEYRDEDVTSSFRTRRV